MKYLKEITVWADKYEGKIPSHTYIFNGSSCIGYIKEGSTEKFMFKTPSKHFSKTGRKFKDVTKEFK
jgi:hypothetical protein